MSPSLELNMKSNKGKKNIIGGVEIQTRQIASIL